VAPNVTASLLAKPLSHPKIFRIGDVPSTDRAQTLPTGFAALDRELVGGGWPQQGLVELLCDDMGIGELSLMLPAHAYLSNARHLGSTGMLWVTSTTWPYLPYAPALAKAGVDLNQFIITKAPHMSDALWTAEQGLLSGSVGMVTVWLPDQQPLDVSLRRLLQAAYNSNALCVLMRPVIAANRPSPAQLRIVLKAAVSHHQTHGAHGALELNLIKRRGLPMGKTIVLQTRSLTCLQREQTTQHRHIPNTARGWLERLITAAPVASVPANIRQRSFEIDR
jgi:protein ImuA